MVWCSGHFTHPRLSRVENVPPPLALSLLISSHSFSDSSCPTGRHPSETVNEVSSPPCVFFWCSHLQSSQNRDRDGRVFRSFLLPHAPVEKWINDQLSYYPIEIASTSVTYGFVQRHQVKLLMFQPECRWASLFSNQNWSSSFPTRKLFDVDFSTSQGSPIRGV